MPSCWPCFSGRVGSYPSRYSAYCPTSHCLTSGDPPFFRYVCPFSPTDVSFVLLAVERDAQLCGPSLPSLLLRSRGLLSRDSAHISMLPPVTASLLTPIGASQSATDLRRGKMDWRPPLKRAASDPHGLRPSALLMLRDRLVHAHAERLASARSLGALQVLALPAPTAPNAASTASTPNIQLGTVHCSKVTCTSQEKGARATTAHVELLSVVPRWDDTAGVAVPRPAITRLATMYRGGGSAIVRGFPPHRLSAIACNRSRTPTSLRMLADSNIGAAIDVQIFSTNVRLLLPGPGLRCCLFARLLSLPISAAHNHPARSRLIRAIFIESGPYDRLTGQPTPGDGCTSPHVTVHSMAPGPCATQHTEGLVVDSSTSRVPSPMASLGLSDGDAPSHRGRANSSAHPGADARSQSLPRSLPQKGIVTPRLPPSAFPETSPSAYASAAPSTLRREELPAPREWHDGPAHHKPSSHVGLRLTVPRAQYSDLPHKRHDDRSLTTKHASHKKARTELRPKDRDEHEAMLRVLLPTSRCVVCSPSRLGVPEKHH